MYKSEISPTGVGDKKQKFIVLVCDFWEILQPAWNNLVVCVNVLYVLIVPRNERDGEALRDRSVCRNLNVLFKFLIFHVD
jgi:hypothetical protein